MLTVILMMTTTFIYSTVRNIVMTAQMILIQISMGMDYLMMRTGMMTMMGFLISMIQMMEIVESLIRTAQMLSQVIADIPILMVTQSMVLMIVITGL